MFDQLAGEFVRHRGTTMRVISVISGQTLIAPRFARVVDQLFALSSGGAAQQYLLFALVEATYAGSGRTVVTKGINTADAVNDSPGDVVVLDGADVVESYEVSASGWKTKLGQAVDALVSGRSPRTTVAASARSQVTPDELHEAIAELPGVVGDPDDLDVTVIDLGQLCVMLAARLSPAERATVLLRTAEAVRGHAGDEKVVAVIEGLLAEK
jgi:hypothetical protein